MDTSSGREGVEIGDRTTQQEEASYRIAAAAVVVVVVVVVVVKRVAFAVRIGIREAYQEKPDEVVNRREMERKRLVVSVQVKSVVDET